MHESECVLEPIALWLPAIECGWDACKIKNFRIKPVFVVIYFFTNYFQQLIELIIIFQFIINPSPPAV